MTENRLLTAEEIKQKISDHSFSAGRHVGMKESRENTLREVGEWLEREDGILTEEQIAKLKNGILPSTGEQVICEQCGNYESECTCEQI